MVLASRVLRKCSLPGAVRLEAQRETESHCPEAQDFLLLLISFLRGSVGGNLFGVQDPLQEDWGLRLSALA